jgi:hypothetical protein
MAGRIKLNGNEYPISVNYRAFKEWELATGLQMSDIYESMQKGSSIDNVLSMLQIAYYAVKRSCLKANIEFEFTEDDFIENLSIAESNSAVKLITDSMMPDTLDVENSGLPAKKKLKTATE